MIRSSSAREIDRLVATLTGGSRDEREAAIARLRVIGIRAVDRLVSLATSGAGSDERVAALKALDGIDDPRARDAAIAALDDSDAQVATAAAMLARAWLVSEPDAEVLDALTSLALDRTRHASARLAALDALAELPRGIVQPVLLRVAAEDPGIAARMGAGASDDEPAFDDPAGVRTWLAERGATAALSDIHHRIAEMRERERREPSARRRQEWRTARGAAHALLARRGSRVALYDLRETFDAAAGTLPLDFLTAAASIGDATCLEPLARAWAAAGGDAWWRNHLARTARGIAARENLTGRHAVMRRVRNKYPEFLAK
jgi:hypothetical protein